MIGEWIAKLARVSSWRLWGDARDDRVDFNLARNYVSAVERYDREVAEHHAAGIRVPFRKRNQDKLMYCLDLIHRRVPGGDSDASVGGAYRTMSETEYAGSAREAAARARYEQLAKRVG